jgi:TPR repeat protein
MQGEREGYFYLAQCYELGTGVVRDEKLALEFYKRAAEMDDVARCFSKHEVF